ncbi:protein PLASTID REDOX INSENSITIVE 2 [Amborella trichopoda]|uniref:protein PLASTID REDOX INSENSITIVE 2 n=1 Tax=Amborella trichopoda TaxID=13333 RepID=UPI0005D30446|nr:protein PLASTID REDOX INSENSITIVE 2 [Amborella trichopoda]|eukprot:XP_011620901.1 protein PLASTID REDOX INSENSITIVE 2 [Amborella trichopoda]
MAVCACKDAFSLFAPASAPAPTICAPLSFSLISPPSTLFPSLSSSAKILKKPILAISLAVPQKYVYPDPIPEFADKETQKFKAELLKKLSKDKDTFGNDCEKVVNICAEIFNDFLHKEYGGPGTLLVEPFTDMLVVLKEKKLPGAPVAARAALLWAQNYVDRDWENWTLQPDK